MIKLRPSQDRGHTKLSWLDSRHTFSFGEYHDRKHQGFQQLRVINEDQVQPGKGFETHTHRDMEIISYVLEGTLAHKDDVGISSLIRAGEVQRMSAGTGIRHSEYNPSKTSRVHFLQIWILPDRRGLEPSYEQRAFMREEKHGRWRLVAAKDGRDGAVTVHQDMELYITLLDPGEKLNYRLQTDRHAWVQVTRGEVVLNGNRLVQGDGAAVSQEEILEISTMTQAEVLLFDLA